MEISVIERIKRLPSQTEESLRDAFSVLMSVEDRKSVDGYVKWIRSEARKIPTADMYELIRDTYFYAGQYSFDDFMIGMEWNREPQARFYLPRRKVLEGKHGIVTKIQNFMDDPSALYFGFSLPPGTGKNPRYRISWMIQAPCILDSVCLPARERIQDTEFHG